MKNNLPHDIGRRLHHNMHSRAWRDRQAEVERTDPDASRRMGCRHHDADLRAVMLQRWLQPKVRFHNPMREKTITPAARTANVTETGTAFWLRLGFTTIS
jgi:hypothetical protein